MKINPSTSPRINPNIFKAYDIRGIYPQELNEETAYLLGRAFVKFLGKQKAKIIVGRDNRLSGPVLHKSLIRGITEAGANVIDVGLAATPMLYWACAHYGCDGGINITASHNPFQYNGFKLVREKAIPIGEKTGLKAIYKITVGLKRFSSGPRGKTVKKKILKDYLAFNFKELNLKNLKSLKIVIDTANAVSGILIPDLRKKLPGKIYPLFEKPDGRFPNHPPDPLIKENLKFLQKEILKKKADLGAAFDGDGDRIIFVDEKGKPISGDIVTALMAVLILRDNPGEKILYDLRSSRTVKETIVQKGGVPVICRIGHSFIKEKMRKENIVFGGEFSGHYYHRMHYFAEAPLFVFFQILKELSESSSKKISEIIHPFKKYFHSGEINFRTKQKEKTMKVLESKYKAGRVSKLDGLRVDFDDWWFLVRLSRTEPLLRLVVEADNKQLMEQKVKEIKSMIENF